MNDEAIVTDADPEINDSDDLLVSALTATDEEINDDAPIDDLFDVTIDGETKKVPKAELIAHYQKLEAADKRLQEASNLRRDVEAQKAQYAQHQTNMAQTIEQLNQQIQLWAGEEMPDWNALLEENPHEYLKQQEKFKARLNTIQQAQAAQSYLQQQQQQDYLAEVERVVTEEKAKLEKEIPEWNDKSIREKEQTELVGYLRQIGYSDQDIEGLSYSRASNISIARKAMLYDRAMNKAKGLKKQDSGAAQPVPTLGTKSHAQGKRSIDDPNLSPEEFARLRREQVKRR